MDYKSTLNLPKTDFPMQGKLPQREPELLARWQELDLYQRLLQARADAPSFVLLYNRELVLINIKRRKSVISPYKMKKYLLKLLQAKALFATSKTDEDKSL